MIKCDRCEAELGRGEMYMLPVTVHFWDKGQESLRMETWCLACVRGENEDKPGNAGRLTLPGGVRVRGAGRARGPIR